jgi:hypothetical protein
LNDDRWREYHVTPRYLAGPTLSGDLALQPLLDLGWHLTHDDLGNVFVASPDHTIRLGYLPEGDDSTLWKITAHRDPFAIPEWLVTFDDRVPTEIIRGFTTELAAAYAQGPDAYLRSNPRDHLVALDAGTP